MSAEYTIKVHRVETDGLPERGADGSLASHLIGRVGFIWNGCMISGWNVSREFRDDAYDGEIWEASEDRAGNNYGGVTHWVEFPVPVWEMEPRNV